MRSLSEAERAALLQLAREAVIEAVCRERLPEDIPSQGIFAERHGVFVTLHVRGRLRGCIGVIEPDEPLGEAVVRSAVSAAVRDPRFPALRAEEIDILQIEISLLSTPQVVQPGEIQLGRHGLLVIRGAKRGLLLPQVAVEHRLNMEQFLAETCYKAELPRDAWRDPETRILAFTCEVFSEDAMVRKI